MSLTVGQALAQTVVALSQQAGQAILAVYHSGEAQETAKDDRSPLTAADLASHRLLVAELAKLDPDVPVLSEESKAVAYEVRSTWSRYWLIDPLDGTKEFLKRNGEFTVNVALVENGRPILGVVHAPVLGHTYWGAGSEAYKQEAGAAARRISVVPPSGVLEVVASRSHAGPETEAFLARLGAEREIHLVSIGSSLKLCLVADGGAHLYPRFGPTMEWDTAAAHAVVEAAGGAVTDLEGRTLSYNKPDLLNPYFMVAGPGIDWRRHVAQDSR